MSINTEEYEQMYGKPKKHCIQWWRGPEFNTLWYWHGNPYCNAKWPVPDDGLPDPTGKTVECVGCVSHLTAEPAWLVED